MRTLLPARGSRSPRCSLPAGAQCVMCYRTAHAQNEARAHVLNMGILLLGAPPFLILAGFVAFVFSKDKQFRE